MIEWFLSSFMILNMPLVSSLKCLYYSLFPNVFAIDGKCFRCFKASQEYPSTVIYALLHPSYVEQFLPHLPGALEAKL